MSVAGKTASGVAAGRSAIRNKISREELLHFSRLITMGQLSACFAHEVTNPLMLIRCHARFVQDTLKPDDPLRINFDVIDRAALRLEEMTRRMLGFSRKTTRHAESSGAGELISEALHLVQPYLKTHRIDVRVHVDPDVPAVNVERWPMLQALVNLLQNAADSMIDAERRVLTITVCRETDSVRIAICDTGSGITSGDLQHIFEPFFTTKGDSGTGLGLFITKQVIEDEKGSIVVENTPHGTRFTISLPL